MSFSSQFHMPGAYHFDTASSPGPALSAGIFRPPLSPSNSQFLARSTGSLYSDNSGASLNSHANSKRKRQTGIPRASTPLNEWTVAGPESDASMSTSLEGSSLATASGAYFGSAVGETPAGKNANARRYILAGQIETPGGAPPGSENGAMEESVYSDVDYRRALGSKRSHDQVDTPTNKMHDMARGSISRRPSSVQQGDQSGWWNTFGGVVGKVWQFCTAGAFTGFYAGGGKGYSVGGSIAGDTPPSRGGVQDARAWYKDNRPVATYGSDSSGAFPQSDYMPYMPGYHEAEGRTPEPTPRPALKRRQTSHHNDIQRNWVMVEEGASPLKKVLPREETPVASRTPTRASTPNGMSKTRTPLPSASTGRRISVPVSRLSNNNNSPYQHPSQSRPRSSSKRLSQASPVALHTREPASFASQRSPVAAAAAPSPSRVPRPSSLSSSSQGPNPFAHGRSRSSRPGSRHGHRASDSRGRIPSPIQTSFTSSSGGSTNGEGSRAGQGHRHRRNLSTASAASTPGARRGRDRDRDDKEVEASPRLDAEARQLANRKRAADRDADARMDAFSARLKAMIREGKEALGTTVEVEVEVDKGDNGWLDDE